VEVVCAKQVVRDSQVSSIAWRSHLARQVAATSSDHVPLPLLMGIQHSSRIGAPAPWGLAPFGGGNKRENEIRVLEGQLAVLAPTPVAAEPMATMLTRREHLPPARTWTGANNSDDVAGGGWRLEGSQPKAGDRGLSVRPRTQSGGLSMVTRPMTTGMPLWPSWEWNPSTGNRQEGIGDEQLRRLECDQQ
jgi:hypothetical protein